MLNRISINMIPMEEARTKTDSPIRTNNDVIDFKVIEALRAGDHMAYNRIYLRYHHKMIMFITSLIKSSNDAEEIAQEIFLNSWAKKDQIDPAKNFNGYIYRMARNAVINYCKARAVRNASPIESHLDVSEYVSGEDIIIAKEVGLLIKLVIAQMPQQRRAIMEMSRYQGLTNDEIAQKLSIQKESVEKQISYAKRRLREVLTMFIMLFGAN